MLQRIIKPIISLHSRKNKALNSISYSLYSSLEHREQTADANGQPRKRNLKFTNNSNLISESRKMSTTSDSANRLQSSDSSSIARSSSGDDDFDLNILDSFRNSYSLARKESSNKWLDYSNSCYIYLYRGGGEPSKSLAAFDLDGTIIKPKSNKRIPKSATDWQLFSVWTKIKLQQAIRDNQARFVIFTNQNGVGLRLVALEEVQERIELVTSRLGVPCTVFVAIDKDEFRKPKTGMYRLFEKSFNESKPIELDSSFYCGDAVGYPSHSDADIEFAKTLQLPFLPPEKFLRGVKPKLVETELARKNEAS